MQPLPRPFRAGATARLMRRALPQPRPRAALPWHSTHPQATASTGCSSLATEPEQIDARGLKCPLPVLKLEKWLVNAPAGSVITVLATDPMARIDIPLYCRQNGHQ